MAQPLSVITSALRSIGALASGETPDAATANDCLYLLNEMLDQWSNDHLLVFTQQEVMHEIVGGQYIYTIGPGGSVGASFTASFAGTTMTVTGGTSGAISAGQIIQSSTGTGTLTAGTAITSLGTALGGAATGTSAIGTYYTNLPNTITSGTVVSYAPRPLRISTAFVRVVNSITGTLDYPLAVLAYEEYQLLGIKTLPGPWPRAVYFQPTMPLGILNYWPNPAQGEVHLFADTILNNFVTLNDTVTFPQGTQGALHWNLAELLMPEFGKADAAQINMIRTNAMRAKDLLRRTNAHPQMPSRLDDTLQARQYQDAGFILHGGFA